MNTSHVDSSGTSRGFLRGRGALLCELSALALLFAYTLAKLHPSLLVLDTLTVGGDTPAHSYVASHLREQLQILAHGGHGRIVSWAQGWWCGFPMFQFYFCLPYAAVAVLSFLMPFNVAFKLVSVAGVLALPGCAYASARIMRLPRPVPAFLAAIMLPFLFVQTHVMWGANLYSTLAGMISNSISFPLMLLFIACAWRDSDDGVFRLRTVLLLVALIASHFFTSVVAALTILLLPLLRPRAGVWRSIRVLAAEGGLGVLLMAWWLVPLVAKQAYAVDFGENWDTRLLKSFPSYVLWLTPLMLAGVGYAAARGAKAVWIYLWMAGVSIMLFYFGSRLSATFVNIRLWPFIFYGLLALAACGLGLLLSRLRAPGLVTIAAALGAVLYVENAGGDVSAWAQWNYEGLERKRLWTVFQSLIRPLDGTPGRLANDLSDENNALGSSRIFECVPHLIHKPILEGGLVNSAMGSMYAYYIQGETSRNCAGFPRIVIPTTFDFTNATRHLKLFNVKHFIAKWPVVQEAMRTSPEWRFVREAEGWQLYELTNHTGRYVFVPRTAPRAVRTDRPKEYGLEWIYTPKALDYPFAFLRRGEEVRDAAMGPVLDEAGFRQELMRYRGERGDICEWLNLGAFPYPHGHARPVDYAPIDERVLDPVEGQDVGGRRWRLVFSRCPIWLDRVYPRADFVVSYSYVNIYSPEARDALLHYSNDDSAKIWLNGEEVACSDITGLGSFKQVPVKLRQGRNRLLHKCTQSVGGYFFHVRLTDSGDRPFSDVRFSAGAEPPGRAEVEPPPVDAEAVRIDDEQVGDDRIAFRTTGVGLPHIIKCMYYPNWKVRGARQVYMVTPGFMLVYPERESVELYYGATQADWIGYGLTMLGVAALIAAWFWLRRRRAPHGSWINRTMFLKIVDGTLGFTLCWVLGYLRYRLGRKPITSDFRGRALGRILIIRPGGMGDMILLLPAIQRLREHFPRASIDLVCEKRNMEVLRLAGMDAIAIPYDSAPFRLLWALVTRRYDVAIDTEQFHNFSAVLALASRAGIRVGFKINPNRNLLYTHLINYDMEGYEGEQFMRLLVPLGVEGAGCRLEGILRGKADLSSGAVAPLIERLEAAGPFVAISPASQTRYKQWDTSKFITLVRALNEGRGLGVALVGGGDAVEASDAILRYVGRPRANVVSLAGQTSLTAVAAVLSRARLFVGGDSGLAHLAIALGLPTVVIFGPSDHLKWGVRDEAHLVVRRPLACSPCFIFGYHRLCRTIACMSEVAAEDVLSACEQILSKG